MPSPMHRSLSGASADDDARSDRAALLRYVLDGLALDGSRFPSVVLPPGVPRDGGVRALDLDAVSVPRLLSALRASRDSPVLDLRDVLRPSAPRADAGAGADGHPHNDGTTHGGGSENTDGGGSAASVVKPAPGTMTTMSVDDERSPPPHIAKASLASIGEDDDASIGSVAPGSVVTLDALLAMAPNDAAAQRSTALIQPIIQPGGGGGGSAPATPKAADVDGAEILAPIPELVLPELRSAGVGVVLLDVDAVAACAFDLFAACAPNDGVNDEHLAETFRVALEVSPEHAATVASLLAPHERHRSNPAGGTALHLHMRLLAEAGGCGRLDDADVASCAAFRGPGGDEARVACVRRHATVLLEALWAVHDRVTERATDGSGSIDTRGARVGFGGGEEEDDHVAHAGAVIEEVSRLVSTDLTPASLATTSEAVLEMVEGALDAAGEGAWSYPPALAGRVYAALLSAAFDPFDEGSLSDEADDVVSACLRVGRALGVSAPAHGAILAWSLARRWQTHATGGPGNSLFRTTSSFSSGPGQSGGDAKISRNSRAYDAAIAADAEAEEDGGRAYRLLVEAERVLRAMGVTPGDGCHAGTGDDATLTLVHAALGPIVWWAEGALGDVYADVSDVASDVACADPVMTPDGFEAVLALGVAAARARAATAAACMMSTPPGPRHRRLAPAEASDEAGPELAARVCRRSVGAVYARLRAAAVGAEDARRRSGAGEEASVAIGVQTLAEGCAASADAYEAHLSARVVKVAGPAAANAAPAALAEYFSRDLCAWLDEVPPLDKAGIEALRAAQDMQNAVAAAVQDRGEGRVNGVGDGDIVDARGLDDGGERDVDGGQEAMAGGRGGFDFEPLRLEARIAPLIFKWVKGRIDVMETTMRRAVATEPWRPAASVSSEGATTAAALSAVELVRAAWDTLDAFWNLSLPAPVVALRTLTEGIDGAFQKYAEAVTTSLGSPEDFRPALPKLTRYKKDVVEKIRKAFEAEKAKARATGSWWGDFHEDAAWGSGPERLAAQRPPLMLPSSGRGAGITATIPQLCCRFASLHFLRERLAAIEREVPGRYIEMQRACGGVAEMAEMHAWLEGLLGGARQTINSCADKVADYVACKTVYWDLRDLFIEGLYRVGVEGGEPMSAVVSRLGAALRAITANLPTASDVEARDLMASALLRAAVKGWTRVMLDGGPGRVFGEGDNDALDEDLLALKNLFLADGDGLSEEVVFTETSRADQLLKLMSLDTKTMVGNYEEAEERDKAQGIKVGAKGQAAAPGGKPWSLEEEGVFGSSTLLRVLCHREDREASKFLKAKMSLPKK